MISGMNSYDLVVIGSGPAGHHAAIQATKLGKKVALVDKKSRTGGICFHTGTIPSKTLREAVLYLSGHRQKQIYGESYRVKDEITFEDLLFRCRQVVSKEVEVYRLQFARNGIMFYDGVARFKNPHVIFVESDDGGSLLKADKIIVATGSLSVSSPDFPVDGQRIFDAENLYCMSEIPKSMIIVGGGVIGMEYACIFAALGVHVTVIDGRKRLLEFLDGEIVEALMFHMREMGVTFRLGETVEQVEKNDNGIIAKTKSNKLLCAQVALYAAGRIGNVLDLDLDVAGLQTGERNKISVNESFQTSVPHIFAAGDVIGFPGLASTSMEQGRVASLNAFNIKNEGMPVTFPYGLYTIPEISFIGQTEEQLTNESIPYEVGVAYTREIARGNILGDTTGRLKIIFNRETEKILGVHAIGDGATELIHIGQAVMAFGGTIRYFIDQVFNYPTLAEAYKVAALHGINKMGYYEQKAA